MSTLGLIHMIFGLVALFAGTVVIFISKGTRLHRTFGHIYLTTMVSLNLTGLSIYNLYGQFGPFHWLALISLITLLLGMIPIFTRRPKKRWLERHAMFMNGSYVGLVAATASEITTRIPGTDHIFGWVVGGTSLVIIVVGAYLISKYTPDSIKNAPARFQKG